MVSPLGRASQSCFKLSQIISKPLLYLIKKKITHTFTQTRSHRYSHKFTCSHTNTPPQERTGSWRGQARSPAGLSQWPWAPAGSSADLRCESGDQGLLPISLWRTLRQAEALRLPCTLQPEPRGQGSRKFGSWRTRSSWHPPLGPRGGIPQPGVARGSTLYGDGTLPICGGPLLQQRAFCTIPPHPHTHTVLSLEAACPFPGALC